MERHFRKDFAVSGVDVSRRLGRRAKARTRQSSNLLRWLIYLIDLGVDDLLECFTFPPTPHAVSFEAKSPKFDHMFGVLGNVFCGAKRRIIEREVKHCHFCNFVKV